MAVKYVISKSIQYVVVTTPMVKQTYAHVVGGLSGDLHVFPPPVVAPVPQSIRPLTDELRVVQLEGKSQLISQALQNIEPCDKTQLAYSTHLPASGDAPCRADFVGGGWGRPPGLFPVGTPGV